MSRHILFFFPLLAKWLFALCSIGRYTRDLPRSTVDSLLEAAFGVWARASHLTFVRANSRSADIEVEFVTSGESLWRGDEAVMRVVAAAHGRPARLRRGSISSNQACNFLRSAVCVSWHVALG